MAGRRAGCVRHRPPRRARVHAAGEGKAGQEGANRLVLMPGRGGFAGGRAGGGEAGGARGGDRWRVLTYILLPWWRDAAPAACWTCNCRRLRFLVFVWLVPVSAARAEPRVAGGSGRGSGHARPRAAGDALLSPGALRTKRVLCVRLPAALPSLIRWVLMLFRLLCALVRGGGGAGAAPVPTDDNGRARLPCKTGNGPVV